MISDPDIERVLNSRCSGDFNRQTRRHWSIFRDKPPAENTVNKVLSCLQIPRLTDERLCHWFNEENEYLYLGFEIPEKPIERKLHIESGMQHEAIYLACTALGVGTCLHNEGIDGTRYGPRIATAKYLLREIVPPYSSGLFTENIPGPTNPFVLGKSLPPPSRTGRLNCFKQLRHLAFTNKNGEIASKQTISQLLWAAKGCTPHYIRPHVWKNVWGLTIPTWGGGQNYTSLYLLHKNRLYAYKNWTSSFSRFNAAYLKYMNKVRGHPTHDLQFLRTFSPSVLPFDADTAIIYCCNEDTNRALWEVGYMLENSLLQARSLNVLYQTHVLNSDQTKKLKSFGIGESVAALFL